VAVDVTGKGAGRGAYVCRIKTCWEREDLCECVGRALKTTLTGEDRDVLAVCAADMPEDAEGG
jgi:predicted RNA-binding protein YlxR (DUF448 family)